jgi:hypothetical protein
MSGASNWDELGAMRMRGEKPALAVIVTSNPKLPQRLIGVGCLVIRHKPGEVMPLKFLDDLDVIFWFERCALVGSVARMARAKGVKFARCRAWCSCEQSLTVAALDCKSYADALEWLEGIRNAP